MSFFRRSHTVSAVVLLSLAGPVFAAEKAGDATRDPRQLSILVADFDGTFAHNIGNYRLRRVFNPETVSSFMTGISGLPEEIAVPVFDFEGNTGPRIGQRLGKLDENGVFVPSTSLEPIELSNGETIVPGLYYLDPQTSYREFRDPGQRRRSYLLSDVKDKLKKGVPFLLEAYPFLSIAMRPEYADRVKGAVLTMRGHHPREMQELFSALQKEFGLGGVEWPEEAFVNLTHPEFYEFSGSKGKYLRLLYDELAERHIQDRKTPHFLVVFENDRSHLRKIEDLFEYLSNRGVYSNPVVPVLVNLVEPEVFENPDGVSWDEPPMVQMTKMSRVAVYWPNRIERSNELSRVSELVLGLSPEQARRSLSRIEGGKFMCSRALLGEGGSK